MEVMITAEAAAAAPKMEIVVIEADVCNDATSDALWLELQKVAAEQMMPVEQIRHRPAIDATRRAYKAMGKDPNRYRPAAEALMRRVVTGKDLYRTTAVVDLVNLVSIATGCSIGAFDAVKIEGTVVALGVGRASEPYEAIGRGMLNIEGLPVLRDAVGAFGTPTSDSVRTSLSAATTHLLITIYCFDTDAGDADDAVALMQQLLTRYAAATAMTVTKVKPQP